jgi:hypothetical protein
MPVSKPMVMMVVMEVVVQESPLIGCFVHG